MEWMTGTPTARPDAFNLLVAVSEGPKWQRQEGPRCHCMMAVSVPARSATV